MGEKSHKVIYNASAWQEEKDPKIRSLLEYISTNQTGKDDFNSRLSALVTQIKGNDIFRREYAAMNLHDRDIQRRARQEGRL